MDELKKALDISVSGIVREQALNAFETQLKRWQIAMPPMDRLVLDFGLGDFDRIGLIECWIANEFDAGYCGKFLFVFEGQTCPMHMHKDKHETFYILKGTVQMIYGEEHRKMKQGDTLAVSQLIKHSFTGVQGPALLLEISKPCLIDDNYFSDTRIPIGGNYKTQ